MENRPLFHFFLTTKWRHPQKNFLPYRDGSSKNSHLGSKDLQKHPFRNSKDPYLGSMDPHLGTMDPHLGTKDPRLGTKDPHWGTKALHLGSQKNPLTEFRALSNS